MIAPQFIHSTVDGHLNYFPFLSIMHKGNFSVCVSGGQMYTLGLPGWLSGKESTCNMGDLGWEDPREKGKAIYSSILAWRIPWTV